MLGDKIKATIRAKYYFGSPVRNAKVNYKVLRTATTPNGIRRRSGIGCTVRAIGGLPTDYPWYPGWRNWGCARPLHGVVGIQSATAAGSGGRARSADWPRWQSGNRNRHQHREARSSRSRSSILNHRRSGRCFAPHHRRPRQRVGGAKAVSSVRLGRSRLLPSGRYDSRRVPNANARSETGARQRNCASVSNCRTKTASRWKTPSAPGKSIPMPTATANCNCKASAAGQYRLAYQVTDNQGHTIEGAYYSRSWRKDSTAWEFSLQRFGIDYRPARVSAGADGQFDGQHESIPAAWCCCSCGRRTAFICRPKCCG